jgi:hypothetical protein
MKQNSTIAEIPNVVPWHGLHGWRGEAVAECARFSFSGLPWMDLAREGQECDGVECVKSSQSRRVLRLRHEGRVIYAKRYLINNWRRQIGNRLAGTKAWREFVLGRRLLQARLATPLPLAYAEHLRPSKTAESKPLPPASYLLTLEWPNAGSVKTWLGEHREEREAFWSALAEFLAQAHEMGFYHDDCAADHILIAADSSPGSVTPSGFAFIDIDNGRLEPGPIGAGPRYVNLFQVMRSLNTKTFPVKLREYFLNEYLKRSEMKIDARECRAAIERIAQRKIGSSVFSS